VKLERTSAGLVIHSAREYDLRFGLLTRGRERALREQLVELARIAPGESVLDVGCATGSLALAAKRRVGPSGSVHGVDPSPTMVDRARRKAAREGLALELETGTAQALPYVDATFDAVTCTLVLHQIPHDGWATALEEMRRVLRPGGRLLLVDITARGNASRTPHAHGHFNLVRLVPLVEAAGFTIAAQGPVAFPLRRFDALHHVLAMA
jgi:ubiquinone/menaquinone biosynthesis C-methylase UbiE